MRLLIVVSVLLGLAGYAVWRWEVRIIVFAPSGEFPEGVTAVVRGVPEARLLDSPDAICLRRLGCIDLGCQARMAGYLSDRMIVVARLPYSRANLILAGGVPELHGLP